MSSLPNRAKAGPNRSDYSQANARGIRLCWITATGIVEFARVFRNNERGPLHHPEFTLLEWYRAHGRYDLLMDDCLTVLACAANTIGTHQVSWRDRIADPTAEPDRLTVAEAFSLHAEIDVLSTLTPEGADRRRFAAMGGLRAMPPRRKRYFSTSSRRG